MNTSNEHHQRTPPTDEVTTILQLVVQQSHHQRTKICHIPTSWHVEMLGSGIAMWQICCGIVVSSSVGGVVQHVRSRCPCSGVWALVLAAKVMLYLQKCFRKMGSQSVLCYGVSTQHDVILTWAKETLWLGAITLAHEYLATSTRPLKKFCRIFYSDWKFLDVVTCKIKHFITFYIHGLGAGSRRL